MGASITTNALPTLLSISLVIIEIHCYIFTYFSFENDACAFDKYLQDHNNEIVYLTYDGGNVGCTDMALGIIDKLDIIEYNIWVTALYYEDPHCQLDLRYKVSNVSSIIKAYNCTNKPPDKKEVIGLQKSDTFFVSLNVITRPTIDTTEENKAKFKLKILTINMSYANVGRSAIITTSVVCGVIGISIIGVGSCILRGRIRRAQMVQNSHQNISNTDGKGSSRKSAPTGK